MLERLNVEPYLIAESEEHQYFVVPIAMGMDHAFALQYLDQRIQGQIAPRRYGVLVGCPLCFVLVPLAFVVFCLNECLPDGFLDTHPSRRIAARPCLHLTLKV